MENKNKSMFDTVEFHLMSQEFEMDMVTLQEKYKYSLYNLEEQSKKAYEISNNLIKDTMSIYIFHFERALVIIKKKFEKCPIVTHLEFYYNELKEISNLLVSQGEKSERDGGNMGEMFEENLMSFFYTLLVFLDQIGLTRHILTKNTKNLFDSEIINFFGGTVNPRLNLRSPVEYEFYHGFDLEEFDELISGGKFYKHLLM